MKRFCKILSLFLVSLIIVTSIVCINVSAATRAVISFNKKDFSLNEELVATVTVNADENMQALQFTLNYNQDVIEFVSGDSSSGGAGLIKVVHPVGNSSKATLTFRFKAIKAGSASISMSDSCYVNFDEQQIAVPPQGGSVSVKSNDTSASSNANLKSLRLGVGTLSPAFSPNITTYDVLIPNSATQCLVYATTEDKNATFDVEGSSTMKIGANKRVVIVTAPNGTQKSYTLNITRSDVADDEDLTSSDTSGTTSGTSSLIGSIDSVNYTIATDISNVPLFKGFSISNALYNGTDVAIATDEGGNYKIYYLKSPDSEELIPCLLDNETNTFEKLKYVTIGENTYIFEDFPADKSVSSDYYSALAKLYGHQVKCYADNNTKLADFYYVYCFSNNRYGVYRYDSKEETLQRSPDFVLSDISDDTSTDANGNILDRFASLKGNAKIMVLCLLIAILIAIALIILLIIKIFKKNDYDDFDEDLEDIEKDFESVTFNEDFVLENEDENNDE